MEDLPAFFGSGPGILPEGVTSLLGELEEAGLGDGGPDELDEMNKETFGAASMDGLGGFFAGAATAVRFISDGGFNSWVVLEEGRNPGAFRCCAGGGPTHSASPSRLFVCD